MKYDFLLVLLVVSLSGNPAVFTILAKEPLYVCTLIVFVLYWWAFRPAPVHINMRVLVMFIGFLTLFALHYLTFGSLVLMASMGFIVMLLIAFLAVQLIPNFFTKYISVMAWLAILSLFFHVPRLIGINMPGIFSFLKSPDGGPNYSHIYIHNFHWIAENTRNSGFFWEPGAFAGYLVIALLLVLVSKQISTSKWKIIALIAALLSTQSTTGYVAGFILFSYWQVSKYRGRSSGGLDYRLILIPFLITGIFGVAVYSYDKVSFLGEKIESQYEDSIEGTHNSNVNRFGNLMYDMAFFLDRPLIGWGATPQTRFSVDPELAEFVAGQGNGLSAFLVKFGLIGFILFFYSFYKNLKSMTRSTKETLVYTLPVLMLLMGEQFLNYPFFFTLVFVSTSTILRVDNLRENLSSQTYTSIETQK